MISLLSSLKKTQADALILEIVNNKSVLFYENLHISGEVLKQI